MTVLKKVLISDLFNVKLSNGDNKLSELSQGKIPLVSAGVSDNGIIGYVDTDTNIFPSNSITVDMFGNAFLQTNEFVTVSHGRVNILVWRSEFRSVLTTSSILYVLSSINANTRKQQYGFSNMLSSKRLQDVQIQLPFNDQDTIDWDYMEHYIEQIRSNKINQVKSYINSISNSISFDVNRVLKLYSHANFANFYIRDLFDIQTTTKKFNAQDVCISNTSSSSDCHPYVVRTSVNNGIRGYIKEDPSFLNKGNTISLAQDTAEFFYQSEPYFTGDKIKILSLKNHTFSAELAQYLITAIYKSFQTFTWGSGSFSVDTVKDVELTLPVKSDGSPDYELMSNYIQCLCLQYVNDVNNQISV